MRTERGLMRGISGCRSSAASIVVFAAVCVLAACSSSGGGQAEPASENRSQASSQVESFVLDGATNTSPFVVKVGSGYLRDVMDRTFGKDDVDYGPLLGANDALDSSEIVVTGYLFQITAGVIEAESTVRGPLTEAQQRVALAELDERERFFIDEGWTGAVWEELEEARRAVMENQPLEGHDFNYAAYRVRVTEVIKGDMNVGDVLDVQVYAGVDIGSEWVDPVLAGTPRVVVAGGWGKQNSGLELRDATGKPIDRAFWPHIDLFWLDEGVWEILEDDTSGGVSETGGPGGSGSVPGGLLEDGTSGVGAVAVVDESLVERPVGDPESHYLEELGALDDAWGDLETLDDLAAALCIAAAERSAPTTTAVPGVDTTTTSVTDTGSATVPLP